MENLGLTFATSAILIQVMSSKSVTDSLLFTKTMKVAFCDVMLVESGENVDDNSVIHEYELEFYCTLNLCTSDTLKNLWSLDSQLLNAF